MKKKNPEKTTRKKPGFSPTLNELTMCAGRWRQRPQQHDDQTGRETHEPSANPSDPGTHYIISLSLSLFFSLSPFFSLSIYPLTIVQR